MKYICNTRCWVAGLKKSMFEPGDIVDFTEDEQVPNHFSCIEPKPVKEEIKPEPVKEVEPVKEEMVVESPVMIVEDKKEEEEIKPKHLRRPTLSKE